MEMFLHNNVRRKLLTLSITIFGFVMYSFAFQSNDLIVIMQKVGDCGQLKTQTKVGWASEAIGGNPGAYRDAFFSVAFPNGLNIGCDYTFAINSSKDLKNIFQSNEVSLAKYESNIDLSTYNNEYIIQLLALSLNIGFDEYDENFSTSTAKLGDMIIASGVFNTWTVYEFIEEANRYIGSCSSSYTTSEIIETLTQINQNYIDASMDGGFLLCPEKRAIAKN